MNTKFTHSNRALKRALKVIPGASQTFSKQYTQYVNGVSPLFMSHGKGSHVWDVDKNEYIDYTLGLLPIILGYSHSETNRALKEQIQKGLSFGLPTILETEVAELLLSKISYANMVRFGKNGSDVTSAAVRAARAYTGKDLVLCCGYHGWQDWYIGTTTRSLGVPEATSKLTKTFEYNNIKSLEKLFEKNKNKVACAIMEPMSTEYPKNNFLHDVKELCKKNNALLIFDEIVTGFRIRDYTAGNHFGVAPDLSVFGKAMGNGVPISAIAGPEHIMKIFDKIFFSFTFGGDPLGLAAAKSTIKFIEKHNVIEYINDYGAKHKMIFNEIASGFGINNYICCVGDLNSRTVLKFLNDGEDWLELKTLFIQEVIKRGLFMSGFVGISYSHSSKDLQHTKKVYKEVFGILAKAIKGNNIKEQIRGQIVSPVFRKI